MWVWQADAILNTAVSEGGMGKAYYKDSKDNTEAETEAVEGACLQNV